MDSFLCFFRAGFEKILKKFNNQLTDYSFKDINIISMFSKIYLGGKNIPL